MKFLILLLTLSSLTHAAVTGYYPGNTGDGFNDTSGAGNNGTVVGTVSQPSSPTPAEGDQWFAQPANQFFRQPPNYISIPNATWNSSDGMEEFWYRPLGAEGGGQSYAIFLVQNADGSSIMEISHPNVSQFFMLIKNNENFHFSLPLMVNNVNHLVREEHDAATGIQDIFVDNVNVLHVTDYTGLDPLFISLMGGSLESGGYSDSTALMDALQMSNNHTDAYIGPAFPDPNADAHFKLNCTSQFK